MAITKDALARMIDHTLLKPEATPAQIEQLCAEAVQYRFGAVCINPVYVQLAAGKLAGSDVAVCTVIGFPFGATMTRVKVYEAAQAILDGAREIDMVLHVGMLKSGAYDLVRTDIAAVAAACHGSGALLKVILENALLTGAEKVAGCQAAQAAGADFVKTSTGFGGGGATVADVRLMRQTVGPTMGIKAAGGVRTLADALAMIEAGATRIGASAGIAILGEVPA